MMKHLTAQTLLTFTALAFVVTMPAETNALDFTYSFDSGPGGGFPGTVSGLINGLSDNATGPAASVIVHDFPFTGSFEEGNDAATWADQFANSFSVTNGQITAATFEAQSIFAGSDTDLFALNAPGVNIITSGTSILRLDLGSVTSNAGAGFGAITFNPVQSLDFAFSFESGVGGGFPGTVSGRILGLIDNLPNQTATSVIIDDFPFTGSFEEGDDAATWADQFANSFSVANGQITAATFEAQSIFAGSDTDLFALNAPGVNIITSGTSSFGST